MRKGMILDARHEVSEAAAYWERSCIEKVWEEIEGENTPRKEDRELIEKTDPDGTKHLVFMYKGSVRATAEQSKHEPFGINKFSYELHYYSAGSVVMMAARPQPFTGELTRRTMELEEARSGLVAAAGTELAKRLLYIIEGQPIEEQLLYCKNTAGAICSGADFSRCNTINDVKQTYKEWKIAKYL